MNNEKTGDGGNVRSLERDSGISDHGLEEDNEGDGDNGDYDDIDCQHFENKTGLSQDLRFLSGMPELCDVMFIVGEEKEAVYGVKAILAIRSRVFYKLLYGPKVSKAKGAADAYTSTANMSVLGRRWLGKSSADSERRTTQVSLRAGSFSSHYQNTSGLSPKTIVRISEFDPDVFKQLLEYVHTGSVTLRPKTLFGLLNAADHFALEELRRACAEYSQKCINLDTVCSLLVTAERYIQYKSSKILVQRVLDFVDKNGDDVLQLTDFVHLPRHVVELILSREELNASEMNKFQAALRWSRHYVLYHPQEATLSSAMRPFVQYIAFHSITAQQLMHEIRPLDVVPDRVMMNALAFQADPASISNDELGARGSARRPTAIGRNIEMGKRKVYSTGTAKQSLSKGLLTSRACSVDRNQSKCSTHSSNGSDSGFHDDCYYYYSFSPTDGNAGTTVVAAGDTGTPTEQSARRLPYRRNRKTPGATVVHVESPDDAELATARSSDQDAKTKSCQDLNALAEFTSVHYRF